MAAPITEPYTVPFTVLVDTAEGQPFTFNGLRADADKNYRPLVVPTRSVSLGRHPHSKGDYSLDGFSDRVAVERKSLEDAQATVLGWETDYESQANLPGRRERFECELENLAKLDAAVVVVEATLTDCIELMPEWGKKPREENAKIFYRSVVAYIQDYGVPWFFLDDRRMAEGFTFRYLARFWRKWKEGER